MARSAKKRPFASSYTAKSDKEDKRQVHRRERRAVRQLLHTDPERDLLPNTRDFGDSRDFSKGDKVYLPSLISQGYSDIYLWLVERIRK
jgi:hypothetical protein